MKKIGKNPAFWCVSVRKCVPQQWTEASASHHPNHVTDYWMVRDTASITQTYGNLLDFWGQ